MSARPDRHIDLGTMSQSTMTKSPKVIQMVNTSDYVVDILIAPHATLSTHGTRSEESFTAGWCRQTTPRCARSDNPVTHLDSVLQLFLLVVPLIVTFQPLIFLNKLLMFALSSLQNLRSSTCSSADWDNKSVYRMQSMCGLHLNDSAAKSIYDGRPCLATPSTNYLCEITQGCCNENTSHFLSDKVQYKGHNGHLNLQSRTNSAVEQKTDLQLVVVTRVQALSTPVTQHPPE